MVAAMAGIAMVAGGLAVVAAPLHAEEEVEEPGGVVVALAAPEGAAASGFSTEALSVPSDEPFTIAFDNQDPAVPAQRRGVRRAGRRSAGPRHG